jgi:hypothetical protein
VLCAAAAIGLAAQTFTTLYSLGQLAGRDDCTTGQGSERVRPERKQQRSTGSNAAKARDLFRRTLLL